MKNEIGSIDGEKGAIGCIIMILLFITIPITAPIMALVEIYNYLKKIWKH